MKWECLLEWEMLLEQQVNSRENQRWTQVVSPLLYPGCKERDRVLVGHLLIGWGMYTGGKNKANTFSLCRVGRETGYTTQEDLKSVSSYNMGERRMMRVCFSYSCIPRPSLLYLFFSPWITTFLPLFIFRDSCLAPFVTLCMSNYLPISLLRPLGTQSQRKNGRWLLWLLQDVQRHLEVLGFLCLLSVRVHLQREMRVHGMVRWLVSASSGWWSGNILVVPPLGDLFQSRRNKINKKVKGTVAQRWIEVGKLLRG